MTDITNIEASQRVLAHLHEGRLVQGTFHIERDGRELACLLGAIAPGINDTSKCPAGVMPAWMAQLTIPMFDWQTEADALAWAARFGAQMSKWHVLDFVAWDRVRDAFCATCVADARRSAAAAVAAAVADRADRAERAAHAAAHAARAELAAARAAAADAAAAAARAAARAAAADAAADAARAAAAYADARASCWARLATALCDLIDAELEAVK
jgi:hypothetical protein